MADITTAEKVGDFRWLFNYHTQCWDKVYDTNIAGKYIAEQWAYDAKTKTWDWTKRELLTKSTLPGLLSGKNDFNYWYSIAESEYLYEGSGTLYWHEQDFNNDGSVLGQVWKWNGRWERVDVGSINRSEPTYIIVHGLRNTYTEDWIKNMAASISGHGQILCIDWGDESMTNDFGLGDFDASEIDNAAARAAILLSQLLGTYNSSYTESNITGRRAIVDLGGFESKINMVGHSFGAHLSAYFASYLKRKIKTIYGLDSAEEISQKNPIILGPSSAETVFFYKSSNFLGGGDTWDEHDKLLGEFNFYNSGIFQLTAAKGLSVGLDLSEHSYAHEYFSRSANSGFTGIKFDQEILNDIRKTNTQWHGIVNGATCNLECVTLGYELNRSKDSIAMGWNYADYTSAINRILEKSFFKATVHIIPNHYEYGGMPQIYYVPNMPNEIYAAAYMTSLSIQELSINGTTVPDDRLSQMDAAPIPVDANASFSVNFRVKNYADNFAFATDEIVHAQQNQHMAHEVWISTGADFNPATAVKLYSSLDAGGLSNINPLGTANVNAPVEIDDDKLEELLGKNSPLMNAYKATGELDLYMHVRVGVDGKDSNSPYIAGELQTADNIQTQAIRVSDGGIRVAFVIDTTGSMGDEINAVKNAIKQKIYDMANAYDDHCEMPTMMLITFKDSYSVELITNDMDEMLRAVSGLSATGGGDTPEHSNHALNAAINAVAKHGKIFIATDAPSHKGPNVSAMVRKAKEKDLSISVMITGSLSSSGSSVVVAEDTKSTDKGFVLMSETEHAGEESGVTDENADDTAAAATALTIGETVVGKVNYIDDCYDWYTVNLKAEYTYSIGVDSGERESFLTLYAADGETELRVVSSGERFSLCPDTDGTYYLKVRAYGAEETPYTLNVNQTATPSTVGTTLESFSILATETGGVYMALKTPSSTADRTKYESAIYNMLTSMTDPAVISVGPNSAPRGTTLSLEINGSNTNWRKGQTSVAFDTDAITINSLDVVSATKLIAHVTIDAACDLSTYGVTVKCGGETAKGRDVLTVSSATTTQKVLSVALTSSVCGSEFTATIHGNATAWDHTTRLGMGPDVNITSFRVVDATTLVVEGNIDPEADLGYRTVKVETGGRTLSLDKAFFVSSTAALTPEIMLVTPHTVTTSSTATLTLTGRNVDFTSGKVSVNLGQGITVTSVEVVDNVTLRVHVETDSDVNEGFRDIRVIVDDQQAILLNALDVTVANDIALKKADCGIVTRDAPITDIIGGGDVQDYYRFTAPTDGTYAISANIATPGGAFLLSLCTMDAAGDYEVQHSLSATSERLNNIEGYAMRAGETAFIRVSSENETKTDYELRVGGDIIPGNRLTANNTMETADALMLSNRPSAVQGWVGAGDACDFYRLQLAEASNLQLTLSGVDTAARVKVYAEQADGSTALLSAGTATAASGLDRTLALTTGSYFIEVAALNPDSGLTNSSYTLELKEQKGKQSTHYILAAR